MKEGAAFAQAHVQNLYLADRLQSRQDLMKGKMKHDHCVWFVKYVYCVPELFIEDYKMVPNEVNVGSFFQNVIAKSTQKRKNSQRYIPHL